MRFLSIVSLPMLLALTVPVGAQTHAHPATPATAAATSVAAQRWKTDPPLREGMGRIRTAVDALQHYEHGHMGPEQALQLAAGIEKDVAFIVANCKLEPKADAMLHLVIADLGTGTDAMAGKNPQLRPALGLVKVAQAVNQYGSHFDHPGFKPIRNVH
jgi:hypothetical protein